MKTITQNLSVWVTDHVGHEEIISNDDMGKLRLHGPGESGIMKPNCTIMDVWEGRKYTTNNNGNVVADNKMTGQELQFASARVRQLTSDRPREKINREEDNNFLTIDDVMAIREHPRDFYRGIISRPLQERVMEIMILQNESFDELFVVAERAPESPLLKAYIEARVKIILDEIERDGDVGDLEMIDIKAYKEAGYEGKDINVVKNESRDYKDYERFLMVKGEKEVVSEEDKDFFDSLVSNMRNDSALFNNVRSKNIGIEITEMLPYSKKWAFRSVIPYASGDVYYFFTRTNMTLREYVEDGFDEDIIRLRIALAFEILSAKGIITKFYLLIADRYNNYKFIEIKPTTLKKLKEKQLSAQIKDIEKDIDDGAKNCPADIPKEI